MGGDLDILIFEQMSEEEITQHRDSWDEELQRELYEEKSVIKSNKV